MDDGKALG